MRRTAAYVLAAGILLTGCSESEPVVGVILEKEYKAPVWNKRQVPVHTKTCTGTGVKRTCTDRKTGTRTVNHLERPECYQFELDTGWEGCVSRAAWKALAVEDTYNSSKKY